MSKSKPTRAKKPEVSGSRPVLLVNSYFQPYPPPEGGLSAQCLSLCADQAEALSAYLIKKLPFCYVSQKHLTERQLAGFTVKEVLDAKLPDQGSVMAGEFGEILTMFYLRHERKDKTTAVRKWRYKQDRNKPTPHSDVIILHRGDTITTNDYVICAESKVKSTPSTFAPIERAVEGMTEDRIGRLARSLTWLKEKAIDHETPERKAFIERFTDAGPVTFAKYFHAVAVIDNRFLESELRKTLPIPVTESDCSIIVLGLDNLQELYERIYASVSCD